MTPRQDYLSRQPQDARRLADVPTWEGVLLYDPRDLRDDRPLRFWRVLRKKRFKAPVCYELKVYSKDVHQCLRKHGKASLPSVRNLVYFSYHGKFLGLQCSRLTMLCYLGFALSDNRNWVVDHIDGDPSNDRPSNLQVISRSENVLRSARHREYASLPPQERRQRALRELQQMGLPVTTSNPKSL